MDINEYIATAYFEQYEFLKSDGDIEIAKEMKDNYYNHYDQTLLDFVKDEIEIDLINITLRNAILNTINYEVIWKLLRDNFEDDDDSETDSDSESDSPIEQTSEEE